MDTLAILRRFGDCAPQPASDWTGTIPLPEEIARFYDEVGPRGEWISNRYMRGYSGIELTGRGNDILLFPLARLWEQQACHRWIGTTGEPIEDWPAAWIVVMSEGVDAYIYNAESRSMYFLLPGVPIERAVPMAGTLQEVIGAIALFCLRYQEAGATARDAEHRLRPEWKDRMRQELRSEAPAAAEDVMRVMTEI